MRNARRQVHFDRFPLLMKAKLEEAGQSSKLPFGFVVMMVMMMVVNLEKARVDKQVRKTCLRTSLEPLSFPARRRGIAVCFSEITRALRRHRAPNVRRTRPRTASRVAEKHRRNSSPLQCKYKTKELEKSTLSCRKTPFDKFSTK